MNAVGARSDLDLREMLDWAIAQASVNVALLDTQMRQLRLNPSICRVLGLDEEADGLGLRLTDLIANPAAESCIEAARTVARTGQPAIWRGVNKLPGEPRVHVREVNLSPVKDPAGQVRGVLVMSFDVTEQHLARERLALVNDASTRIGTTLDVTRTAEELVDVAVPGLADFATVDLLDSVFHGEEPASDPLGFDVPLRRMACGSVLDGSPETLTRPGQMPVYPSDLPIGRQLTHSLLIDYDELRRTRAKRGNHGPVGASRAARYCFHSAMVVPMRARGATLGIATFVRHRRPEPFQDDDLVLAEEIVARAAVCMDNARRYSREHATALTLQRSLLPQHLPGHAAVQIATRYLPAGARVAVGGDWFDVIQLSGSRVGLVVGDVAGHGIHAAATMGRLRTAVRTLAEIDLEPGELLTRLDDVVTRLADEEALPAGGESSADINATCLYAVYDPVSRCCSLARAGHPPPAIVRPGCPAEFLDLPAGPPLGVGGLPFEEAEVVLPEDSLLVLYTDGMLETRQRDIDTGLTAMRKVLNDVHPRPDGPAHATPSLEAICDTLVGALHSEGAEDDAALLIARTRALAPDRVASWDLPADPAVVAGARAQAADQVAAWGLEEATFTTELVVSELLTNAIRHAAPPIQLRMILDDGLSCEVSDGSSSAPHLRRADRNDEGGRGLLLVSQLTERWGSRHTRTGKTIWAQQPLTSRPN